MLRPEVEHPRRAASYKIDGLFLNRWSSRSTSDEGTDAVIDFVNSTKCAETDIQLIQRRARLVFVGLFGGELRLNLVTMPKRAYTFIESYTGTLNELTELVSLTGRGVIKPLISNRFRLNQATEALQTLKDGKIVGRGVINP
jgi:alcohol dehydrogenase, propanol-preferring